MKTKRKIISILLSIFIIVFFPLLSISKDNKNYFFTKNNNEIFGENQNQICLTPGENETMLNFSWYSNSNNDNQVKICDEEGNEKIFIGVSKEINNGLYSNKVKVTGLKDSTTYNYSYKVDNIWSKPIEYKTKNSKEFSFVFMGDPQIGASSKKMNSYEEGIKKDTLNWNKAINKAIENQNNLSFIVCGGDETNTTEDKDDLSKLNISNLEYSGFLSPCYLQYMPIANAIGNHDKNNENFYNHFYMPNQFNLGQTKAGSDYYFVYGDSLFIFLNTNNLNIKEHKKFIENAVAANENIKWRIAVFHHDIYGGGFHRKDKDIKELRDSLPSILEKNKIDLVLSGHDHIYSRTYTLKEDKIKKNFSIERYNNFNEGIEIINNPKGITYITAGSCTGSKFYETNDKKQKYIKFKYDKEQPIYTIVNVYENNIVIATYEVNSNHMIDNKIIIKKK